MVLQYSGMCVAGVVTTSMLAVKHFCFGESGNYGIPIIGEPKWSVYFGLGVCCNSIKSLKINWEGSIGSANPDPNNLELYRYFTDLKNGDNPLGSSLKEGSINSQLTSLGIDFTGSSYKLFDNCAEIRFKGDDFKCYHGGVELELNKGEKFLISNVVQYCYERLGIKPCRVSHQSTFRFIFSVNGNNDEMNKCTETFGKKDATFKKVMSTYFPIQDKKPCFTVQFDLYQKK